MERDLAASSVAVAPQAQAETQSAVSWGAVVAGAAVAMALSFVLVALAGGFGLRLLAPWPNVRAGHTDFTPFLGSAMIVVQVLSSALGGYLAGRLRTKWTDVHGHEAYFRDTAHGLLTWAVSTLAGVVLVASVLSPLTERATVIEAAAASASGPAADIPGADGLDPAALRLRAERETNVAAQVSLFMGVGLLLGAFTACVAAAIGGLRRDEMHTRYWTERGRVVHPARG